MKDIYLKFPNEQTAREIMYDVEGGTKNFNTDMVGIIDGVDGWHVNVRLFDDETLVPDAVEYVIEPPLTPKRVWA